MHFVSQYPDELADADEFGEYFAGAPLPKPTAVLVLGWSGANGEFVLPSGSKLLRGELRAALPGCMSEPLEPAPGETALVLRLWRCGTVHGGLLVDPLLHSDQLRVVLEPAGRSAVRAEPSQSLRLLEGGEFRSRCLRPGIWNLTVEAGSLNVIWRRPGIVVESGQTLELGTIDLANLLTQMRVEVRDEAGSPIAGASLSLGASGVSCFGAGAGRFTLFARELDVRAVVHAPGYETLRAHCTQADNRVVLRRGVPLRIVAKGAAELERDGIKLGVQVRSDSGVPGLSRGETYYLAATFDGSFAGTSELLVHLPIEGIYTLTWTLGAERDGRGYTCTLDDTSARGIRVERGDGAQVVQLVVPPGLLADNIERVRKRLTFKPER